MLNLQNSKNASFFVEWILNNLIGDIPPKRLMSEVAWKTKECGDGF